MLSVNLAVVITTLATLTASSALTAIARELAVSCGLLDVPNARSSHVTATPRAGGLAIVLSATIALLILTLAGDVEPAVCLTLLGGGAAVATVGFLDDRHTIPVATRLLVHTAAAAWAVMWIGGLPAIVLGDQTIPLGWFGAALGIAGVVWVLNLFNFMDGIDGIAASEAVFVSWGALIPMALAGISRGVSTASLVFGAACLGFLPWNWPPAKIFMGDVGSGYIGYAVAVLALAATHENPGAAWVWLILGGVFFIDATMTLVRRVLRRERVYQAHRNHAYQWLARRWRSHLRVTVAVLAVNVFWLLPCSVFAALHPAHAAAAAAVALTPLVVVACAAGSGRSEARERA